MFLSYFIVLCIKNQLFFFKIPNIFSDLHYHTKDIDNFSFICKNKIEHLFQSTTESWCYLFYEIEELKNGCR